MLTFLFWNIQKKPLLGRLARLATRHAVDVVMLAECDAKPNAVLAALPPGSYHWFPGSGRELQLYSRLPVRSWQRLGLDPLESWVGLRVHASSQPALTLFVAHLPSKLRTQGMDRLLAANELMADLQAVEVSEQHDRTILVGDLNVNPFEKPVAWAGAIHAVMSRDIIRRPTRIIRGRRYKLFYNPMWGVFGDRTPGPPGTYFRSASHSVNYFWNTYDQVLLRPDLMGRLDHLEVLQSDGIDSLLTPTGRPDRHSGSDHLPVLFRLNW